MTHTTALLVEAGTTIKWGWTERTVASAHYAPTFDGQGWIFLVLTDGETLTLRPSEPLTIV